MESHRTASLRGGVLPRLLISIVILVALVFFLFWWLRPTALVTKVVRGVAPNAVPGTVTVIAQQDSDVKSQQGGRILESNLEVGKKYKAGDVLLQIDPSELKLQIKRAEAELEAAKQKAKIGSGTKFQLQAAEFQLKNAKRLFKSGNIAQSDLDNAQRSVDQLKQQEAQEEVASKLNLSNLETDLASKKLQLQQMTIRAPIDCVVSQIDAYKGDLIGGGAPIAHIISLKRIVEAKISEENFAGLKVGQKATVRFLGYGGTMYNAKVSKILPTADPDTQRYIVYLDVDINPDLLVPGITGETNIVKDEHKNAMIIPRQALLGDTVYVVKDGRVHARRVKAGYRSLNEVEIVSGLKVGDEVISDQLDRFRDGDRVKVQM